MKGFWDWLLGPEMPPHGHCYLWNSELVYLHVISDVVITVSYFTIPFALVYLVRKRDDLKFNSLFYMFALFIFACGATHLMNIYNVWHGAYWLSGGVKLITALASLGTALLIWPIIPKALAIPSNSQLMALNQQLQSEVDGRLRKQQEVERLSNDLSELVEQRTRELAEARLMRTLVEKTNSSLERSNEVLGQYARVTAYDMREPLRSVRVYAQMLSDKLGDSLDDEGRQCIKMILGANKRVENMVDGLRNYSECDKEGEVVDLDLDALLLDVLNELGDEVRNTGVQIDHQPLGHTHGVREHYRQLMLQLISNGIKFSAGHETPRVEIGPLPSGGAGVGFYVRDNGVGIAKQYHARILGLFERLNSDPELAGTGVGLAICKRIVDESGGRLDVVSDEGKGAEFRVTMPSP